MAIILGVDPGSRITGYGVIETCGSRHRYIASGCIRMADGSLASRLQQIFDGVCEIIRQYKPEQASIEKVFMHENAQSAIKLGQARGAAIVAMSIHMLEVAEYSPREIKKAVVGYGAADKTQMQQMVKSLLNLSGIPQVDAADGLAAALCHAAQSSYAKAVLSGAA